MTGNPLCQLPHVQYAHALSYCLGGQSPVDQSYLSLDLQSPYIFTLVALLCKLLASSPPMFKKLSCCWRCNFLIAMLTLKYEKNLFEDLRNSTNLARWKHFLDSLFLLGPRLIFPLAPMNLCCLLVKVFLAHCLLAFIWLRFSPAWS